MNSEVFLAFNRAGAKSKPTIEFGVSYDFPAEIDHRNDWHEKDEPDHELRDELVSVSAKGLAELIQFCFHGQKLTQTGEGLREAQRRFVALAFAVHPELFVHGSKRHWGKNQHLMDQMPRLSLKQLCRCMGIRATPHELRKHVDEFFGKNWKFKIHLTAKKAGHASRTPRKIVVTR